MSRLAESLSRFFGRVEIFARGADDERRATEEALVRGDFLEARAHARALLERVPGSPLGLALWADASEGLWLHDDVVTALAELAEQVPWRQEVWLRLGIASARAGAGGHQALERAATGDDPAVSREALLALADLDIAAGESARAERWLERVASHPSKPDPELALRRAECAWALGRPEEAKGQRLDGIDTDRRGPLGVAAPPLAGRVRLLDAQLARAFPSEARGGDPLVLALGAMLLDAPGAKDLVAELLADCHDAAVVAQVRRALEEVGEGQAPRWQAAFALAEGRRHDAREALLDAVRSGDGAAAATLLHHAVRWRDLEALQALASTQRVLVGDALGRVLQATELQQQGRDGEAIEKLAPAVGASHGWAEELIETIVLGWIPPDAEARWESITSELRLAASDLLREDLVAPIEALALERDRPLFVAVLGEFNAGKSTLLNALLSTDVAPTGIRPTTASLHWVAWAPDPFARIEVVGQTDRVVPHAELKGTLAELHQGGATVGRVNIYAPIERLKRIEILDTPGFNAPDESHAAQARRGISEAHVVLWILDATAPLKDSERRVIEEIAGLEVPIQVLVNKRDRVGEDDIEQVMRYVRESLDTVGIASLRPPLALSARLALDGRMGDAGALEASRWQEVEALLSEHVVNRADLLRERALRRKALRLAEMLAEEAATRSTRAEAAHEAHLDAVHARRALAARLRSHRRAFASELLEQLVPAIEQLRLDARPVAALDEVRKAHPEVRAYLVDRTVARLAEPLADALAARAERHDLSQGFERELVRPSLRAVLSGAAAAHGSGPLQGDLLRATFETALLRAADALEPSPAEASDGSTPDRVQHHRLRALVGALRQKR